MGPRTVLALALCAGCGRIGFADLPDGGASLATHTFRKPITITPVGSPDLDGFAVSIQLASDAELAAAARTDGRDLAFTDALGQLLPFEIVAYEGGTGRLDAWVAVPRLTTPVTLYLYYGGTPVTGARPWSARYAGVWHMNLVGNAAVDSVAGHPSIAGTAAETPSTSSNGIAGAACGFDGVDDSLQVDDPVDGSLDFATSSFSFSAWVLVPSSLDLYDTPLHKGGSSDGRAGYDLELGTQTWDAGVSDGASALYAEFGPEAGLVGAWVHLVAVVDRVTDELTAYANGLPKDVQVISSLGSLDSVEPLQLGRSIYPFRGLLDEPRVYREALTPDWIANEYANLATPSSYVAVGPEQPAP